MRIVPLLAPRGPSLSLNFLSGTLDGRISFSRSSTGWYFNSSGLLVSASSGVARFDYGLGGSSLLGLLIEAQSTNLALYSRDLTNAAWTKISCTAAKDQTGIDGSANSASSLTATGNGATCLQSITQSSTKDTFSVYLKRITGTGTVKITLDGGSTYTDVTSSMSSSAWYRGIATETVTNASFGIQLGTSGDKIAVDCAQIEAQGVATSPIITTSATVTRSADVASIAATAFSFNAGAGSFVGSFIFGPAFVMQNGLYSGGPIQTGKYFGVNNDKGGWFAAGLSGNYSPTPTVNAVNKIGFAYTSAGDFAALCNGGTVLESGSSDYTGGSTTIYIGEDISGPVYTNVWVQSFKYWPRRLTNGQLQSLTR